MKVVQLHKLTPKQFLNPSPTQKNSQLGPQKVKITPKIKSKWNDWIEGNIENESCSTTWVDPKTFLNPTPTPKPAHLGTKKTKTTPKLSQIPMSEFRKL